MSDLGPLAEAVIGGRDERLFRLGVVEADNFTAIPPTLTVDGRVMRYIARANPGDTVVYVNEGRDPFVIGRLSLGGDTGVPVGSITGYSLETPPKNWLVCNGQSTAGYPILAELIGPNVPDLRDRFIAATGTSSWSYRQGSTGGTDQVTLSVSQLPSHFHTQGSHAHGMGTHSHGYSASTGTVASHIHGLGSHSHSFGATTDNKGFHNHLITEVGGTGNTAHRHADRAGIAAEAPAEGYFAAADFGTLGGGGHTHGIGGTTGSTDPGDTFSGGGHGHSVSGTTSAQDPGDTASTSLGDTGATGSGSAIENRPRFYALTFIIKAT